MAYDRNEIGPLSWMADRPPGRNRMNGRDEQRRALNLVRFRHSILPDSGTHIECICEARRAMEIARWRSDECSAWHHLVSNRLLQGEGNAHALATSWGLAQTQDQRA